VIGRAVCVDRFVAWLGAGASIALPVAGARLKIL
jgi:hypothetical protein